MHSVSVDNHHTEVSTSGSGSITYSQKLFFSVFLGVGTLKHSYIKNTEKCMVWLCETMLVGEFYF